MSPAKGRRSLAKKDTRRLRGGKVVQTISPTGELRRHKPKTRKRTTTKQANVQSAIEDQSPPQHIDTQHVLKSKRHRRRAGADPWLVRKKKKPAGPAKPRAPPPTHFTCRICVEEIPVENFIAWITKKPWYTIQNSEIPVECIAHLCRSPRRKNDPVCRDCISNSMAARMDQLGARMVTSGCLEPG
jgi:hypothetical protein